MAKFADCLIMVPTNDTAYMHRCIQLARLGSGHVAPNPMVGAVLVHEDRIIGEGYHMQYGRPHAEVNCLADVAEADRHLISSATLYVSLEPCAHFGKTPPCADAIVAHKIPRVVIGCRDPFAPVNGKGIERLKEAGIDVVEGVLVKECAELNKRFFCFHKERRPYVVLKWAQTADGRISGVGERLHISNEQTNRLVHQWRSEEASIMVATRTAMMDDPKLSTRLWPGKSPLRLVIDKELKLPSSAHLLDGSIPTIVFNEIKHDIDEPYLWGERNASDGVSSLPGVAYYGLANDSDLVNQVLHALYSMKVQSVLVEGGSMLLQSFIDSGNWDEARIITNLHLQAGEGLPAPQLKRAALHTTETIQSDHIAYWQNTHS